MKTHRKLLSALFCLGSIGIVVMLTTSVPSCKAQEVNPTHFTATGFEDEYSAQKPPTKKATPTKTSAQAGPKASAWTVAALQKEKKAPTAGSLSSIAANQPSAMGVGTKRAARRVSVKKSGEPPRE